MEAILATHTAEQSVAASNKKQIRIKTPINQNRNNNNKGLLNPPSRAMSLTSHPLSASSAPFFPQSRRHHHQQPPLLPLPTIQNRLQHRHQPPHVSLTAKKSKQAKRSAATQSISEFLIVASDNNNFNNNNNGWGPDPNDLPKHLPVVGSAASILSPPPSSLPLPKFPSLRSKLVRCKAEATGVDDGATNNLRRLLRLR